MASQHQPEPTLTLQGSREDDPIIEGLRGWAALMVMATHYIQLLTAQMQADFTSKGAEDWDVNVSCGTSTTQR